jgi:hypothetical protein
MFMVLVELMLESMPHVKLHTWIFRFERPRFVSCFHAQNVKIGISNGCALLVWAGSTRTGVERPELLSFHFAGSRY